MEGGLQNTENSMSLEDCEWTLEWTGGQARALKVAAFPPPPPPRDITLLSSEMSQDWKSESLLSTYQKSQRGYCFPLHMCHLLAQAWP